MEKMSWTDHVRDERSIEECQRGKEYSTYSMKKEKLVTSCIRIALLLLKGR
jgi:hypothetical protein